MKNINIELTDVISVLGVIACIILFTGTPDLMDAILYNLTGGKIAIPTP